MGMEDIVRSRTGEYEADGIFGNYSVVRIIGHGGFSEVREVSRLNHRYAMKVPLSIAIQSAGSSDDTLSNPTDPGYRIFYDEALRWARLSDRVPDAVVRLIDFNIDPFPWMVMELAERDMEEAIGDGDVTADDLVPILRSLQKIHDMGIVHRDIKPGNILLVHGCWRFSDFGLSKSIGSASLSGSLKGTPEYMAPEQYSPKKLGRPDERTDIWQMGILAYRVITGRSPYVSSDPLELMTEICGEGPDLESIPARYRPVFSKALTRDRNGRFASASEFADALEKASGIQGKSVKTGSGQSSSGSDRSTGRSDKTEPMRTRTAPNKSGPRSGSSSDALIRSANRGDPESQFELGRRYYAGEGTSQSYFEAFKWYKRAAEQEHPGAQFELGRMYEDGLGTKREFYTAKEWYLRAAANGNEDSMKRLKSLKIPIPPRKNDNGKTGEPEVRKSNRPSTVIIRHEDSAGGDDVSDLIRKAESGDRDAQYDLASRYYIGFGVPQSNSKAAELCLKAARKGHVKAQFDIGHMYENGIGVQRSIDDAMEWYRRAASNGNTDAMHRLSMLGEDRIPCPPSEPSTGPRNEGIRSLILRAQEGDADAQYELAGRYYIGLGVTQSDKEAAKWYLRAAYQGHRQAQLDIAHMYDTGTGVPASFEKAREWRGRAAGEKQLR